MKIVIAITSLGVGGAERLVTALADRYVADGHQVVLVRFHGEAELRPSDPRVHLENLEMRRTPLGVLAAMRRFRQLIKAFRPNVVNSHLVHANILTRLLRLVTSIPRLVSSAHNTNEEGRSRILAYRLTDRLADISTNVSLEAVEAFEEQKALKPGRMLAIHNGINTKSFRFCPTARSRVRAEFNLTAGTSFLLAVGRLWEQKDYPNLLKGFAQLATNPALPFLAIVGEGPLQEELQAMSVSLGINDRVRFLGVRHDVSDLMSACDLFVLSSAWEGFGLVVAEAMACERPVVATDCGGVREVVGDAGFLVPPRDSTALAASMEQAFKLTANERGQLGLAARERVLARFSLDVMAEHYLSVYKTYEKPEGLK